jgi:hypothetical protein
MANTYKLIASSTVGSGGTANIQFTSIPGTYTDLILKMSLRQSASSEGSQIGVRFNGSTSGYSRLASYGRGNGVDTAKGSSETFARFGFAQSSTYTASIFGNYEMYIPDYASTTEYKTFKTDSITESTAVEVYGQGFWGGLWSNTSAITSILLEDLSSSTSFAQYSTAYLYGISSS